MLKVVAGDKRPMIVDDDDEVTVVNGAANLSIFVRVLCVCVLFCSCSIVHGVWTFKKEVGKRPFIMSLGSWACTKHAISPIRGERKKLVLEPEPYP